MKKILVDALLKDRYSHVYQFKKKKPNFSVAIVILSLHIFELSQEASKNFKGVLHKQKKSLFAGINILWAKRCEQCVVL